MSDLEGLEIDPRTDWRELRDEVAAVRVLEAVDTVRWALDRRPDRLSSTAARLTATLAELLL